MMERNFTTKSDNYKKYFTSMVMNMKTLTITLILIVLPGCAEVANIIVPPHPRSLIEHKNPDVIVNTVNKEAFSTMSADVAGIAKDGLRAALLADQKQYSASFTTRYFTTSDKFDDLCSISFYFNPKLVPHNKGVDNDDTFSYTLRIDRNVNGRILKLEHEATVRSLQSKVAVWPVLSWINDSSFELGNKWDHIAGNIIGVVNPFMMIHAFYGIFDESIYETDLVAKLKIQPIIEVNGERKFASISAQEISSEIGRYNILTKKFTNSESEKSATSKFPENYINPNNGHQTNFVLTVIESNKMGDYIGKAADLLK